MNGPASTTAVRLGVIGMSAGNGHPYSWSAIINGYDSAAMASCPFPAIPAYLSRQSFPQAALAGAQVTHIWTQQRALSEHVARAALIPTVVDELEGMLGQVDGVLLARDDADRHLEHARIFLRAGVPVYIDKPLAFSRAAAQRLFDLVQYPAQIFSCTALRYAAELQLSPGQRRRVGAVRFIDAVVPKEWKTYAIHAIEPVLAGFPETDRVRRHQCLSDGGITQLTVQWLSGVHTRFTSTGTLAAPIEIAVHGSGGSARLRFRDAFSAFKAALADFIHSVQTRRDVIAREQTLRVIELIEMGCAAQAGVA